MLQVAAFGHRGRVLRRLGFPFFYVSANIVHLRKNKRQMGSEAPGRELGSESMPRPRPKMHLVFCDGRRTSKHRTSGGGNDAPVDRGTWQRWRREEAAPANGTDHLAHRPRAGRSWLVSRQTFAVRSGDGTEVSHATCGLRFRHIEKLRRPVHSIHKMWLDGRGKAAGRRSFGGLLRP